MAKATHMGTCQICGRSQKISAKRGLLAKHGYTVEGGYFDGECEGSGRLPFEVTCINAVYQALVLRDYIAGSLAYIHSPEAAQTTRMEVRTPTVRWGELSRYVWLEGTVELRDNKPVFITEGYEPMPIPFTAPTIEDAKASLHKDWIEDRVLSMRNLESILESLSHRIASWTERQLEPVAA